MSNEPRKGVIRICKSTLRGVEWGWGVGGSECSGRSIFIFFIKENWICAMTKHHVESNITILLRRNLRIDSDVRQWSHPLMMPLHCLWAKSNNRAPGQFECDVTWFCFCFVFVRSHARCGCCSIACWRGWGRGSFKRDVQGQGGRRIFDVDGQGRWEVLKIRQSWTSDFPTHALKWKASFCWKEFYCQGP